MSERGKGQRCQTRSVSLCWSEQQFGSDAFSLTSFFRHTYRMEHRHEFGFVMFARSTRHWLGVRTHHVHRERGGSLVRPKLLSRQETERAALQEHIKNAPRHATQRLPESLRRFSSYRHQLLKLSRQLDTRELSPDSFQGALFELWEKGLRTSGRAWLSPEAAAGGSTILRYSDRCSRGGGSTENTTLISAAHGSLGRKAKYHLARHSAACHSPISGEDWAARSIITSHSSEAVIPLSQRMEKSCRQRSSITW